MSGAVSTADIMVESSSREALTAGWRRLPLKFAVQDAQTGVWGDEPNGGEDDILCARVADFDRAKAEVVSVPTVRRVSEKDREKCGLRRGDLLIEKSGGTGKNPVGTAVSYQGPVPAVYANFILRLRMTAEHDPRFWLYALHSSHTSGRTWNYVRQTTGIQNLDVDGFLSMKHAAPDHRDQSAIADYLDRETGEIDAMLGRMEELVASLRERKADVIQRATVNRDCVFTRLKFRADVSLGKTVQGVQKRDDERFVNYVRAASIQHQGLELDDQRMWMTDNELARYDLLADDVLIVEGGAGYGRSVVLPEDMPGWGFQNHVIRVRPQGNVDGRFLDYCVKGHYSAGLIDIIVNGATIPALSSEKARELPIPDVDLGEQKRIADHLDEVTAKIDAMLAKVADLKSLLLERRAALITDVVTGRKEVA